MEVRETHEEVMKKKNLPKLGQTVRSKKYGTLWRVIETKENWRTIPDDPAIGGYRMASV